MSTFEDQFSNMIHLMNYGMVDENKKTKYDSVEYSNKGADGKTYGIIREGSKFYIKELNKDAKDNVIAENYKYIGGITNKNKNEFSSYANALKHFDLKMMSLKEAYNNNDIIVESYDPNKREEYKVDSNSELAKEIRRQQEIMKNAELISEGKTKKHATVGKGIGMGNPDIKAAPFNGSKDAITYEQASDCPFDKDGKPKKCGKKNCKKSCNEEVLAWNDNEDYLDMSHGTEIGKSDPFKDTANDGKDNHASHQSDDSQELKQGTVNESTPSEPSPVEVNDWDEGLPEEPGCGEIGKSDPFKNRVNEDIDDDDDLSVDDDDSIEDTDSELDNIDSDEDDDYEIELDDDNDEMSDDEDEDINSQLQSIIDKLDNIEDSLTDIKYNDEPLYDDESDEDEPMDDESDEDEPMDDDELDNKVSEALQRNMNKLYESRKRNNYSLDDIVRASLSESINNTIRRKRMVNEEGKRLDYFGKHPAYRKEPMTYPTPNHQEMNGYRDWNHESVKNDKPYALEIGDGDPFEISPEDIDNSIAESINKVCGRKKK